MVCFRFVCFLVDLSAQLFERLWINLCKIFGTRNSCLDFGDFLECGIFSHF